MQVYNGALSLRQIISKKRRCFRRVPVRPRPGPSPTGRVCNRRLDLVFLVDGSGSIEAAGRGNFKRCIEFVKTMVSSFSVSPQRTRVGVALFSSRTWLILDFHQSRSKATVLRRIDSMRYPRGGTKIGRALNFVLHRLFRRSRRALKALVVMTDGISQDRVRRAALALRNQGVRVFALGIGRRYRRHQLLQIATNGRFVFTANFRSLNRVARRISRKICRLRPNRRPVRPVRPYRPSGKTRAVAIFPLNGRTAGKDISSSRNARGKLSYVRAAPGPDGSRDGSYQFYGRSNSYILIPNRGNLDTKRSITLLAWIFHQGRAGPIFNYMPNGWGVHFWMITPRTLFVRFTRRRGRRFTAAVVSRSVTPGRWQFVGASYNGRTGQAKLFVNRRFTARKYIGRIRLATNYPVRMGARIGDGRYFRGRISCMQVYNGALSLRQIISKKRRCFRRVPVRPRPGPRPTGRVCNRRLDLAFLVDGSGSIETAGRGNFKRCIEFVKTMVSSFSVSPQRTRVGVVLFASRAWLILDFYRSRNKAGVLNTIARMRYPRGGTRIGKALKFVLHRLFRRSRRALKALVVMTDGISQDRVRRPALALRSRGVWVYALGIGRRYRRRQLEQIATNGRYVFTANFRSLNRVARRISSKICRSHPLRPRPFRPGAHIRPSGKVCRKRLDLALLIDGSGSINAYGRGNFGRCLDFVKRLVASFSISPTQTRVGIVLFSTRAWLIANFRRHRNKQSLLRAISRIRYPRGGTKIGRALRFARYRLFRRRTNRRKVLLVITDGISQDSVLKSSRALRNAGVRILALGIGRKFRRAQLNQITANPRYVFNSGFRNLHRVVRSIKRTVCKGRPIRPRPIRPRLPVRPSGKVCRKRLDLAFLIDGSGSINAYGRGNFRRCLNFVKRLVASFSISPTQTRVGIVLFSTRAWLIANFRRYRNKQSLLRAISRIRYPRGGTKIGRAMRFAKYQLFRRRTNRRKVLLVMTDGISQDSLGRSSRDLRNAGVRILALGIGRKFRLAQLNQMAANPRYVFKAGFRNLHRVVRSIKRTACGARRDQARRTKWKRKTKTRRFQWRRRRRLRRTRGRRRKRRMPWGKKRDVVIVKPDNFNEKDDDNHSGADDDGDGESSRDSKQVRGSQRSEIAQLETKVKKPDLTPSYLWRFGSSGNNSVALDEVHGHVVHLEGGASISNTTERGLVADTNGGWLSLKETNNTCFSDPGHCSENGMTVMSWIKLNKTSLSDKTSSYIMSSGGQSTASRGFAVLYMPKRYIVILSTKNKQWKLNTPVLPSGWFNLAFTWRESNQLKLFVNGTYVTSSNPALVSRPHDSFTTFDVGRPNNSDKLMYRFPLRISDLALWERELSEQELKSAMYMQLSRHSEPLKKNNEI